MTITVDAGQATLASKATVRPVTLVRLRTFTNVLTQTVNETHYWANVPVRYQWVGGTTEQFDPLVRSISPVVRGFPHIPDGVTLETRDGISIELDAAVRGGSSLWTRLSAQQLVGALVDVASVLIPEATFAAPAWFDLSALGSVHVVRWRGEVTAVSEFDYESGIFSLACDTVEPVLNWPIARHPLTNDPRDVGKRYPIPAGVVKSIRLVGREVGHTTTLVSQVPATGTSSWSITDGTGFPTTGTGTVQCGNERVSVNFATSTATSLVVTARAADGTVAEQHPRGATVLEYVREARWVLSGREVQGISALYWEVPDGQRVRLPASLHGFNPCAIEIEPGYSLGVVSFSATQLRDALAYVSAVLQQPAYELAAPSIVRLPWTGNGTGNAAATGSTVAVDGTAVATAGEILFTYSSGSAINGVAWTIDTGFGADVVIRLRPVFDVEMTSDGVDPTELDYNVPSNSISGSVISSGGNDTVRNYTGGVADRQLIPGPWITPSIAGVWTLADLVASGIGSGVRVVMGLYQNGGGSASTDALLYTSSSYWEVEVEPPAVNQTLPTDVSAGWSVGNGLTLVADCRGIIDRLSDVPVTSLVFTSLTGWTSSGCSIALATVDTRACIAIDVTSNSTPRLIRTGLTENWSVGGGGLTLEVFVSFADKGRLDPDNGQALTVTVESAGASTIYGFGPADVLDDAWTTLCIDFTRHHVQSETGGGVNLAAVTGIRFGMNLVAGGTPQSFWRNVRLVERVRLEHPINVGQYLVEDFAGLTGAVDASAAGTAITNLPGVLVATDLRRLGDSFASILARLGFEGRANWSVYETSAATKYRPFAALTTYAWPAASRTLVNFRSLKVESRQLDEITTEFSAVYNYQSTEDASDIEAFRSIARADATVNDISVDVGTASITAAQSQLGIRPAEPTPFLALNAIAPVVEVWAYYVKEALRYFARRYSLTVDYQQGFDLEPGDIVEFVTPWDGATIKARITRTAVPFDAPGIGLSLEQVI